MFVLCNLHLNWFCISCHFLPTSSDLTTVILLCDAVLFDRSITLISRIQITYLDQKARHHNSSDWNKDFYQHKHQGLDPLIRSVSRVTTALPNVSLVFQLFCFLVVCSDMISKGFGLVAFFASVKASSVFIHLSCLAVYLVFMAVKFLHPLNF